MIGKGEGREGVTERGKEGGKGKEMQEAPERSRWGPGKVKEEREENRIRVREERRKEGKAERSKRNRRKKRREIMKKGRT